MFEGKGKALSTAGLNAASQALGVDTPALWSVITVETKGCGFLKDRRPVILFERHIFHQRTQGRFDAAAPDLSNPVAGGYGPTGETQYEKLTRAVALDRQAALESASWGLGQIMGFNAKLAGFAAAEAMVTAMIDSEDAQFIAMAEFIRGSGLADALQQKDWPTFARRYNGPDFQKNLYDQKLAQAYARYTTGSLPDVDVRAAQLYLTYLGYAPGGVDGVPGQNTRSALMRFQTAQQLPATGNLDAPSLAALVRAATG